MKTLFKSLILADMEKIKRSTPDPEKAEADFNATLELMKAVNKTAHD